MDCKLVVLLVFASFAHGSYVQKLVVSYGLSEDQVAVLDTILANEYRSSVTHAARITTLFELFYNSGDSSSQTGSSSTGTAPSPYDSVAIALGNSSCDDIVQAARSKSTQYLSNATQMTNAALKLSEPGQYSVNKDQIESYQVAAMNEYENSIEVFFEAVSACLNTDDEDVKDLIEQTQDAVVLGQTYANNALFNAIKVRANTNASTCGDVSYITQIKDLEAKSRDGVQADRESRHILLRALYLYNQLNKTGIAKELFEIQRAFTVQYRAYRQANEVLFSSIRRHLRSTELGFDHDGELAFSLDDTDLQAIIALIDVGDFAISDSLLFLHPENVAAIRKGQEIIHGLNVARNEDFYVAVAAATADNANYEEVVEEIEARKNALVGLAPDYNQVQFGLIRNNQTFSEEVEAELVSIENLFDTSGRDSASLFIDAVVILANATSTGDVYDGIYTEVDNIMYDAFMAVDHISQSLSAANLEVLLSKE